MSAPPTQRGAGSAPTRLARRGWLLYDVPIAATSNMAACLDILDAALPAPARRVAVPNDGCALHVHVAIERELAAPAWLTPATRVLSTGVYHLGRADGDPIIEAEGLGWGRLYRAERRIAIAGSERLLVDGFYLSQMFFMALLPAALRLWGLLPIHACAVDWQGRALIFPAESGSGKSTLALALVRGGFKLLSDDMPIVQRTADGALRLLPFPEHSRVLPGSLAFFPELAHLREQAERSGPKLRFDLATIYPGAYAAESRPAAIVLPRIAHAPASVIEPCPPAEALTALMAGMAFGSTGASMAEALPVLGDLVNACRTYRLHTGTDFDDLPGLLRELALER